jgi:hypothetical protein
VELLVPHGAGQKDPAATQVVPPASTTGCASREWAPKIFRMRIMDSVLCGTLAWRILFVPRRIRRFFCLSPFSAQTRCIRVDANHSLLYLFLSLFFVECHTDC